MTDSPHDRFEALLEVHRGIVTKVTNMYCWDAEDRSDLVQEISLQLWKSFPAYDERRPFATWMYRIALNVAISFVRGAVRRRKSAVSLDAGAPEPIDPRVAASEPDERVGVLRRLIGELDELNRALLLLYLDEHSYQDIAEILGISQNNVRVKISRLKDRLRKEAAARNLT